ncbi:MAG: ribosomal L7Ae/L30e/S12e/Gadd45 family protein [Oscillospiraceae bacterium]|nr:ribosomal L7Ae/L30e/S12e/Gadd45 family protein [Oscillospiraceae bacterium]
MENKALGLLSLARKGRKLEAGEEPVGMACRAQRARLVLLAGDASEHTVRRVQSYVSGTNQPWLQLSCSKAELGAAIGRSDCAMAALTDVRLALAFVNALGEPERYAALLVDLEARSLRVAQRQREERNHQRNIRRGEKKKK